MKCELQTLLQAVSTLLLILLCYQNIWNGVQTPTSLRARQPPLLPADAGPAKRQLVSSSLTSSPPPSSSSPPPPPLSPLRAPFWEASVSEASLKRMWRMPPGGRPGSRAAMVEIHNESWSFLNERQLTRGVSSVGDPLRMQCMAARLLAGDVTKLSTVGGSVSFGTTFTTSRSKSLFHWKVYQWVNATFGGPRHEHYCGAVAASGPSYMEHCLHWHVVDEADLVLIEYAVNLDEKDKQAELASFERMLRKLLAMPRQPALVLVNTMELFPPKSKCANCAMAFTGPKAYLDGYSDGAPSKEDMLFEYPAWAEDGMTRLAQYYGVPAVSLRDALFHELKAADPRFPVKQVFHDRHHPGAWGHSLMAQMVVGLLSAATTEVAADLGPPQTAVAAWGQPRAASAQAAAAATRDRLCGQAQSEARRRDLSATTPLFSESAEAAVGTCVKGEEIQGLVAEARGFAYRVEGSDAKLKPGLIGTTPGDTASLCLDVARLQPGQSFVAILGHLISYEHMGMVSVQCAGDCDCKAETVDAHVPGGKFSVFKARTLAVRRAEQPRPSPSKRKDCGCVLKLEILKETGSGEHKFKVLSLMTAVKEAGLRYGHQTGFNVRPMGARLN